MSISAKSPRLQSGLSGKVFDLRSEEALGVFDRARLLGADVKGILGVFVARHAQARDCPREDIVVFEEGVEADGDFVGIVWLRCWMMMAMW